MANNDKIQVTKSGSRDETAKEIARLAGLSPRQVRRIIKGECENEPVLTAAITYVEGKNELLEKVKELLPFN